MYPHIQPCTHPLSHRPLHPTGPASEESIPDVGAPGKSEEGAGPNAKTESNHDVGAPGKSEEGAGPNVKT
eukprot:1634868-Prorocentrum_lima.AAC.1